MKIINIRIIAVIFTLFICILGKAQEVYSGKVLDENSAALPLVNVVLLSESDSTIVTAAVTDNEGLYHISAPKGSYIARFSFVGFSTLHVSMLLDESKTLPDIQLMPLSTTLSEVEIKGEKPTFRVETNALLVNVQNDKILSSQTNVYEMLGLLPGVLNTENGITVLGKGKPVYYINGRKILDESEVTDLQVDQIQSVKVINGNDIRYDAAGNAVIAIKVRNPDDGLSFTLNNKATLGHYFSHNHAVNLSYSQNNWDVFFVYSYGDVRKRQHDTSLMTTHADTLWNKTETIYSALKDKSHNYKIGFTKHFTPNSQFSVQYIGTSAKGNGDIEGEMQMVPNKGTSTMLKSNTNNRENSITHHLNSSFSTNIGDTWKLDVYGDYIRKYQDYTRNLFENDGMSMVETSFLQNERWDIYALHTQLNHSIKGGRELTFGHDFSYTKGTDKLTYNSSTYNNNTRNTESRNSFYVNYSFPIGGLSINTGARYEKLHSTILDVSKNEKNKYDAGHFMPTIGFSFFNYSSGLIQSLSYSVDTRSPEFSYLNNHVFVHNRYSAGVGNLNLKAEVNHSINYMLMYKFIYFTLSYGYAHNPIVSCYYSHPQNSSVVVGTTKNFDKKHNVNAMLNLRKTFNRFTSSLSFVLMKSFFQYPGLNNVMLRDSKPVIVTNLDVSVSLPEEWLLTTKLYYNWGGDMQMIRIGKESSFDVSLKKTLLNKRLTLSFDAHDIFNKSHAKASWQMNNLTMMQNRMTDTRKLSLSLVYRFREAKSLSVQNAAHKEMSRLKINEDFEE